jgi:hypothetical protein
VNLKKRFYLQKGKIAESSDLKDSLPQQHFQREDQDNVLYGRGSTVVVQW